MDKASHLSLIIDLSPSQWLLSADPSNAHPLPLHVFLSHVLTFINSHIASKHENSLAVFGALPGKSVMLYSSSDSIPDQDQTADESSANSYRPFRLVDSAIVRRITEELELLEAQNKPEEEPVALVGALTKALCYINRITHVPTANAPEDPAAHVDPRILILSVSPDLSTAYIPVMNSIFSAQKLKVTIDVCKVYGPDTVFLQQTAHLTAGSYIYLERRDALLQYLIMSFLPPPALRQILAVPKQDKIDFRAACFCHKNIVDIGFVCSVCLSIFCAPVPVCSTCRTKFPIKTLQRLNASRPILPGTGTPSSRNGAVNGNLGGNANGGGMGNTNGGGMGNANGGGMGNGNGNGNGTPRARPTPTPTPVGTPTPTATQTQTQTGMGMGMGTGAGAGSLSSSLR
ncbi:Tfb4-domain-containing protein [Stereum hirsutum FP-91666 SS1]|uniref:Tfb4-domain-containing protein n=1 Tax=Stereum hirsutum (strain FP-91666) TaxID=721885 RepID=UPI000444A3C8|nr:Tfb4-domain-containing protein [Stereum hirsutum FP-91666 SS1]EIM83043.1 Tfb4-domain-containing protein [Stereum hirsutum FP-91666 SS1]